MNPLAQILGQGYGPPPVPDVEQGVATIEPGAKRPYRNLDVWPRTRAMLAAAEQPLTSGEIARALGVDSKNVLMALAYHAAEVERLDGRPYRFRLRGAP